MRLFLISFLYCSFSSLAYAGQCRELLNTTPVTRALVLAEIGEKIEPVLKPIIVMGSVLGRPADRKVMADTNHSHFGELGSYRSLFKNLMGQTLANHFDGRSFQALNFNEQDLAVKFFIQELVNARGEDALGRSFFMQYLEKWVYQGLSLSREDQIKFSDAKRSVLVDVDKLNILFGDFFIQFFQNSSGYWEVTSHLLESLMSQSYEFTRINPNGKKRLLGSLESFNPVTGGSDRVIKDFLNTSAVVVFQMLDLSSQAIAIQRRLEDLSHEKIRGVRFANEYSGLINDFSQLLVEIEILFSKRELLYQELLDVVLEERESSGPGFFDFTKHQINEALEEKASLIAKQEALISIFYQYENLSTSTVLNDFANINRLANQVNLSEVTENLGVGVLPITILNKMETIDLQRSIVLGALERLRNGINSAE